MLLLLALLLSLLPISAFAELPTPPPVHPAPQGWNVIPDGQGGVTYWRGQGGTDAYTAQIIGQGLTRQQSQTPAPRYTPAPLEVPQSTYRTDREIDRDVCANLIRC